MAGQDDVEKEEDDEKGTGCSRFWMFDEDSGQKNRRRRKENVNEEG